MRGIKNNKVMAVLMATMLLASRELYGVVTWIVQEKLRVMAVLLVMITLLAVVEAKERKKE